MIRQYLLLWWTLATALAIGVGSFVRDVVPGQNDIVDGLLVGLIVGVVQWALLLAADERLHLWPLVTAAGWAIMGFFSPDWPMWGGPWLAILQWLVLRRYTRDAGWWYLASAVGWFLAWWGGIIVRVLLTDRLRANLANAMLGPDAYTSTPFYLVTALNWTLGGLVYGLVTAVALAYILEPVRPASVPQR